MTLDEAIAYVQPVADSASPEMHYGLALNIILHAARQRRDEIKAGGHHIGDVTKKVVPCFPGQSAHGGDGHA